ncbi:hypothetical protein BASA81_009654 [Batrachochytrium salamandrivorans]|nr:hypothetical protein BASA81_009654 [Batrachochytrium salamandrivorans]
MLYLLGINLPDAKLIWELIVEADIWPDCLLEANGLGQNASTARRTNGKFLRRTIAATAPSRKFSTFSRSVSLEGITRTTGSMMCLVDQARPPLWILTDVRLAI